MIDGHAGDAANERPSISGHVEIKVVFLEFSIFDLLFCCQPGPLAPPESNRPRRKITARSYSWETIWISFIQCQTILDKVRQWGSVLYNARQSETIWVSIIQCKRDNIRQSETMSDMIMRESVRQQVCILAR